MTKPLSRSSERNKPRRGSLSKKMPTPEEIAAAEAAAAEEAQAAEAEAAAKAGEEAEKEQPKKYSFGGNEYNSADEALEAARNLEGDYTRKSQRLSELEKEKENSQPPKKEEPEFDPEDEKVADQLYTIIKKKHGLLTREEVEEQKQLEKIDHTFKGLEGTYKGEDGLPKFKTDDVIKFMRDNNYPPHLAEEAFKKMHEKEFLAAAVKKAMDGKGGYETETPKGAPKKVGAEKELNTKADVESFVMEELAKAKKGEME